MTTIGVIYTPQQSTWIILRIGSARGGVTLQRLLSLAEPMPKLLPDNTIKLELCASFLECTVYMRYLVERNCPVPWWRHQMETFSLLLALCDGEFTGDRWFPLTKASDAELWCFYDVRLNKRLNKQSICLWFEASLCSLWRHCNATVTLSTKHFSV